MNADSDVDLLVVMQTRNPLDQVLKIRLAIPAPFPLDLLVRTPETLKWRLKEGDCFLREIVSRGKVLYEMLVRAGAGFGALPLSWLLQSTLNAASRPQQTELDARIQVYELAFRMQASAPGAVDLSQETADTQALYGIDQKETETFGRMCLLSRRLVERGVRFVQLYSGSGSKWDAHKGIEANHSKLPYDLASVSVPGYEFEEVLGRGGMGVVYKARHLKFQRTVALKMVLARGHAGPRELARFRIEAESVARLQHPNIVQIHEVGESGGQPKRRTSPMP